MEDYVLVLEDRTEVQNASEVGKLSIISDINEEGELKTTSAEATNQSSFLKFNNQDGLLKNFMKNFLKQFNDPTRFGLYKVLASNVEQGVESLRSSLQNRHHPASEELIKSQQVSFEAFLPMQKRTTAIYTEARLAFRTDDDGNIGLAVHAMRKEPQLDFPYMGYKFSPEDKAQLLKTGNLGKTIEVVTKQGELFDAYVSIDQQTNELLALRADRVSIPKEIKGVTLSDQQYKDLVEGKAVKVEGMTSKNGKPFDATLQVNADKKGIEFIFGDSKSLRERQEQSLYPGQSQGAPRKLCGLELTEKQREALDSGRTLYLKNMVDKEGKHFNAYVRMDKEQNRPRFFKYNPEKKQGKQEVEAVAEGHKTQVAVNNEGKTNEATKHLKEPLKSGQTEPTADQKQKQERKARRGHKL